MSKKFRLRRAKLISRVLYFFRLRRSECFDEFIYDEYNLVTLSKICGLDYEYNLIFIIHLQHPEYFYEFIWDVRV